MEDVNIAEENKEPTPTSNEVEMCNANFRDVTTVNIAVFCCPKVSRSCCGRIICSNDRSSRQKGEFFFSCSKVEWKEVGTTM